MDIETLETDSLKIGVKMYKWASDLFPLNRSITGQGNRETLQYLKKLLPDLKINNFKSGEEVFDWTIPDEWHIDEGFIEDEFGNRIIDFKTNNLHILGYSEPVDTWLTLDQLNNNLYSLPEQPNAIPYITSYYKRRWGFCITHEQRLSLKDIKYHAVIKSKLFKGQLDYGELIIEGQLKDEILLSTYICHPSMGNNELSGIVVTSALAQLISSMKGTRYSYRILFIPETIGSIAYLSCNWQYLKNYTKAGFVITCVGDNNNYSFLPSRTGDTYADKIANYALNNYVKEFKEYSFLERGSDERQFCSPLIDLPVVSIMRSKYATYPEYHTSLDNLNFISKEGLLGSYNIYKKIILLLENNITYKPLIFCEPQLGKRGLYNITSNQNADSLVNIVAYIDGKLDLIDLCKKIKINFFDCLNIIQILLEHKLIMKENGS
jgi:aminopeptidase-like protein